MKLRNFELMTKKRSSEILADEKALFWGKVTRKRNFSSQSNKFSEIGGNASLSQGGCTPLHKLVQFFSTKADKVILHKSSKFYFSKIARDDYTASVAEFTILQQGASSDSSLNKSMISPCSSSVIPCCLSSETPAFPMMVQTGLKHPRSPSKKFFCSAF